ncbi:MAG: type II toxin-antitoxin system VapC family toxin [Propioniciclava sp.]
MIAVDTNILVYAHRQDSPHHRAAAAALHRLASGAARWAIPWPCLHEFLAVVTHPRIYRPPTSPPIALTAAGALAALPNLQFLPEAMTHLVELRAMMARDGVTGPRVHDARIAAICRSHGVSVLWTADRDFSWFPELRTKNPLTDLP